MSKAWKSPPITTGVLATALRHILSIATLRRPAGDDYGVQGVETGNTSANITLQDVYIHGFSASGLHGPIGGAITLTRVFSGFNGFAGWNFQDNADTPDAVGSTINASYVWMEGNGCNEQYPIVNTQFPAKSCYDDGSNGFGGISWSGQDTTLASFTCDHCSQIYNTKDGFIGPHAIIASLTITNSQSIGNMGQQWKWGSGPNSTVVFENNLTVGNCGRMAGPLLGAPPTYNRHLSDYCRAAGDILSFYTAPDSKLLFANNTIIADSATTFDLSCKPKNSCGSARFAFRNNVVLGYLSPGATESPNLFYYADPSVKVDVDHDLFFGLRSRPCPLLGRSDLICNSPAFVDQPAVQLTSEAQLDHFNFRPRRNSPVVSHAVPVSGLAVDFFGAPRPNPPAIGAVEP